MVGHFASKNLMTWKDIEFEDVIYEQKYFRLLKDLITDGTL